MPEDPPPREPVLEKSLRSLPGRSAQRSAQRSGQRSRQAGQPGRVLRLSRSSPDYGCALERSAHNLLQRQIALDRERAEAGALVPELLGHSPEGQRLRLHNDPRFHTWGVLERLLEESRGAIPADGRECERLASLALAQADHLDAAYYGPLRLEDMRARVWATLAEALRLRSHFAAADEAFERAHEHLCLGTGDSLEWAFVFDAEAALRRCQRRFADAKALLRQALETFVENGEDQRVGLSLVTLATVHRDEGNPQRAIPLLQEALRRIDGEREPRLLLCARHALADSLAAAGRFMEARGLLIRSRPLYRRFPDAWTQGHLRWLRGRIALGFGQMAEAEAELVGARTGFEAQGAPFEAALAALDLAALYARQERTGELKPLAAETAVVFAACGVERESRAATAFRRLAEEAETAHRELARAAGDFPE